MSGVIIKEQCPLSFQVKLGDGCVVRHHQDHIRVRTCDSSPELSQELDEDIFPAPANSAGLVREMLRLLLLQWNLDVLVGFDNPHLGMLQDRFIPWREECSNRKSHLISLCCDCIILIRISHSLGFHIR